MTFSSNYSLTRSSVFTISEAVSFCALHLDGHAECYYDDVITVIVVCIGTFHLSLSLRTTHRNIICYRSSVECARIRSSRSNVINLITDNDNLFGKAKVSAKDS